MPPPNVCSIVPSAQPLNPHVTGRLDVHPYSLTGSGTLLWLGMVTGRSSCAFALSPQHWIPPLPIAQLWLDPDAIVRPPLASPLTCTGVAELARAGRGHRADQRGAGDRGGEQP